MAVRDALNNILAHCILACGYVRNKKHVSIEMFYKRVQVRQVALSFKLEDTARYAGLLLAPAEGFGLRLRLFLPFGQKKSFL